MAIKDRPAIKRILSANCPLLAFWFPWYWRTSDTSCLRKVAGRWLWRNESGFIGKSVLLGKTIVWPVVAFFQLVVSWCVHSKDIKRELGCSRLSQLGNLIWLTFWRGFPAQEFYGQRMYLDKLSEVIDDFLSSTEVSLLNLAMSSGKDAEIINNKGRFEIEATRLGLPVIPTICTYDNGALSGPEEEVALPRTDLYLKPVNGLQGRGIERWDYDPVRGNWSSGSVVKDGWELKAHFEASSGEETCIIQEAAFNHPHLETLSPGGLITFRVMSVWDGNGEPEVMGSHIVLPTGKTHANHGVYGGMVAQMNTEDGMLMAAFKRLPEFRKLSHHPDTGGQIEGFYFSDWPELKALAISAHKCFPHMFTIGWDLAFTRKGPEIVEGNSQWGSMPGFYPGKTSYVTKYLEALRFASKEESAFGALIK